jgi:hypothetical protein
LHGNPENERDLNQFPKIYGETFEKIVEVGLARPYHVLDEEETGAYASELRKIE